MPDGTNQTLEEIRDKKVSSGTPGGGQSGVIVVNLQRLEPYYGTQFLAELFRGMLFKWKGENKKSHQK